MYSKLALRSIARSFKDFGIYFVTLVFSVCVFYAFNSISEQGAVLKLTQEQNSILDLLANLIGGLSIFLAVVLGFLVVYANRYLIKRRKREFAIYLTLGMSRRQVSRIIILETAVFGVVSLIVGLVLGYLLSQVLLYITAALFEMTMPGFTFFFSPQAALFAAACFAVMFLVTLAFNIITVSRYKLIDLLLADRKSEGVTLRNLPLSIALFIIGLVMIIAAYWLLIDNGMLRIDSQFLASVLLVCVGTVLFFYALSGFLLRVVQGSKKLYLSGLNMFTLRQLNSRINSAFVSISIVCMVLFLALTSMCTGFSVASILNDNLESGTRYDASYSVYYNLGSESDIDDVVGEPLPPSKNKKQTRVEKAARAANFDIATTFARDVKGWNNLVASSVQIDIYNTGLTMRKLFAMTNQKLPSSIALYASDDVPDVKVWAITLSRYNELLALLGKEPATLGDKQFLVLSNNKDMLDFYEALLAQHNELNILGTTLNSAGKPIVGVPLQTSAAIGGEDLLIVPDNIIPSKTIPARSLFNVMYNGSRADVEQAFTTAVADAYGDAWQNPEKAWPFLSGTSAETIRNNSARLSGVISYLAIYIGLILLVTCAAILALQQLTEAVDNAKRYTLLNKIGTEQSMINRALFLQIGIYFVFPLLLALAHSVVAMSVTKDILAIMGHMDITGPLIATAGVAVAIYGGYFLLTYLTARRSIRR